MNNKPWENEPDRLDFEYKGFKCKILRQPNYGHLCGYVGLPSGHPYYHKGYQDIPVIVHGGFTFAEPGDGEQFELGYWWIGFDCAHAGDIAPYMGMRLAQSMVRKEDEEYRDIDFVTQEIKDLVEQLTPEGVLAALFEGNVEI